VNRTTQGTASIIGVVALLGILTVQGVIDFRSRTEAFPTISMPSFEGSPDTDGHRTIEKLTIVATYADGSVLKPDAESLFQQFHYSSARYSIDHLLRDPPALAPETLDWLRAQASRVGNGAAPESLTFTWQRYDLDVASVDGLPVGAPTITEIDL
jgi:hypothetical protein